MDLEETSLTHTFKGGHDLKSLYYTQPNLHFLYCTPHCVNHIVQHLFKSLILNMVIKV